MSCLYVPIESFYNVNKSCQVIVGNPPIVQGLKSPQFRGIRVIRLSQRSRPQQVIVKLGISKQRVSLSIYHTLTHTQLQRIVEEEEDIGARKKEATAVGKKKSNVLILSLRKLQGFLHLWFPRDKTLCSLSLLFDCCACYSLS